MQTQIRSRDLRLGMYLTSVGTSWLNHPFWRSSFLITSEAQIRKVLDAQIEMVWIDTSKGLAPEATPQHSPANDASPAPEEHAATTPVAAAAPDGTQDASPGALDFELPSAPPRAAAHAEATVRSAPAIVGLPDRVSVRDEADRASAIIERCAGAVKTMHADARAGHPPARSVADDVVAEIADSVQRNSAALIGLARLRGKDSYSYMHSMAVSTLMVGLARALGLEESHVRLAGLAGLLADVGKCGVPVEILEKSGPLDERELSIVRTHPSRGAELLRRSPGIEPEVLDVCLHHHERIDGGGYPDGLAGSAISLFAKMAAICDVYDAITSPRAYKDALPPAAALRQMAKMRPGSFDDTVFAAFIKTVGLYPVGTLVQLKTPRLAVVLEQNRPDLSRPKLKLFYSITDGCRIPPAPYDLGRTPHDGIAGLPAQGRWSFNDLDHLWAGRQAVERAQAA